RLRVRAAHDVGVHRFAGHAARIYLPTYIADLQHVADDLRLTPLDQEAARDSASGHAPDSLAIGGPPATAIVADAELGLVGVVGVAGAIEVFEFAVVFGAGVLVAHQHPDRRTSGDALEDAGEDFDLVALFALRGDAALSGAAAIQIGLN